MKPLIAFLALCLLVGCKSSSEPELHIFTWSDYIKPAVIQQFKEKYKCRVIIDTFDSNESMYAKLKLGAAGYDVIFPSNYYLEVMVRQQMLRPLEQEKLPNLIHLDRTYLELIGPSTLEYGVPYTVSGTGLAYRKDKIPEFEASWTVFAKRDLRGRMTMLNDLRETLGAALRTLGYSVNSTKPEEITAAADLIIQWKPNLAKFESEQYKNGIASAEFLVCQGYSGDVLQIMEENSDVGFAFPKEGFMLTADYLVIPTDAPNVPLAYAFINFLLEPEIAAQNIEFTRYLIPNTGAYPLLPPDLRSNTTLFPSKEILQKSELIRNVDTATPLYNKAWDRIKSAH